MTGEERLAAALREARNSGECSPAVEERLRTAFRKRHSRARWPVWAVGAVAAALAVWVLAPKPQPQVLRQDAPPPIAVREAASPPEPAPVDVRRPAPRVRRPRPAREVATQFYALDAGVIGEAPNGYMMRVRVPRATMASFGLPVNQDLADQRIDADVLMGTDGTARAIRFVRTIQ